MKTLWRFLADETAASRLNYILGTSIVSLVAMGTIYEARLVALDRFDAIIAALKKTRTRY